MQITVTTIIAAFILGIVIGPLARLLLPGRQDVNLLMTVLLGAVGALAGSIIVSAVGSGTGFNIWALLTGVVVAAALVLLYTAVAGNKTR
ncbi:MAG: GlsB/YeaQ/YmgE family stress response membrane protein [Actinobacteria bacterium]|nr:GlsB/YeaQ/YmgE family stress response membrane protein [Actinomycetota bacterium]